MKVFQKKSPGQWKTGGKPGYGGGGKKFGGPGPTLHRATCATCGTMCEVPFRPNGKKPVLCRDCFRKESGGAPAPRFGGSERSERPAPYEKPAYRSTPRDSGVEVVKQLKDLNRKMDELLHALAEIE